MEACATSSTVSESPVHREEGRIVMSKIMGRSLGGETSMLLSLQARRSRNKPKAPALSLALAITPGYNSQPQDRRMTSQAEFAAIANRCRAAKLARIRTALHQKVTLSVHRDRSKSRFREIHTYAL